MWGSIIATHALHGKVQSAPFCLRGDLAEHFWILEFDAVLDDVVICRRIPYDFLASIPRQPFCDTIEIERTGNNDDDFAHLR